MSSEELSHWLHHSELGELPARALIECVFVLAPTGRILHFHREEMDIETREDERHYTPNGTPPKPERARCQVIPPFVTQFPKRS